MLRILARRNWQRSTTWIWVAPIPLLVASAWRPLQAEASTSAALQSRLKSSSVKVNRKTSAPRPSDPRDANQEPLDEQHGWFGDDEGHAWSVFSQRLSDLGTSIAHTDWSAFGDRIAEAIVPRWAQSLPLYITKLQKELQDGPDTLKTEILQEAEDEYINPEIECDARVRIGNSLCAQELEFRDQRKRKTAKALARYLGLNEAEVHHEDVPVIAVCGSGGGLRALVAGASSYLCAQEAGLLDCVTYTAGVSGSCWLQALYHSSLGKQDYRRLIGHLKHRLDVHIAYPPAALQLLTSAPTNKFLLSGLIEKVQNDPDAEYGLVDIYGLLLSARLLVPRGELEVDTRDLKLSNQQSNLQDGEHPMPIYTAVRHEIPLSAVETAKAHLRKDVAEELKQKAKQEAWFQWFEWTPYEFWSDEVGAGVPTWSMGRKFDHGINRLGDDGRGTPEMRIVELFGIWGSAFCATLSHYYKEIRPVLKGLAGYSGIDQMIIGQDDDLIKVHPIDPATVPNYARGLQGQLPSTCPPSLLKASHLQLMDAGMSNNLPIYPLLRPGRDVDILVAFDASAEVKKDNWLSVADGYAQQRGIKGWPIGVGWPQSDKSTDEVVHDLETSQATSTVEAAAKVAQAQQKGLTGEAQTEQDRKRPEKTEDSTAQSSDLGYCTIWLGTTEERHSPGDAPASKRMPTAATDSDWSLAAGPDSGIAVVYFPFLANQRVPGVDPLTSDFMSTWNFIYTPEQIDEVVALARANFDEGKDQTRRCVRAVYERKKRVRLEAEAQQQRAWEQRQDRERRKRWERRWERGGEF